LKFKLFLITVFVTAFLLVLPYSLRTLDDNPLFPGEETYYHTRIARQILGHNIQQPDAFAYDGRPYNINPYHFLLAGAGAIVGFNNASTFLPIILGIVSTIILFLILQQFKLHVKLKTITLLFWTLSPIFIYTFTLSNPYSLLIPLNLLGVYLFMRKEKVSFVLSVICFAMIPLFGFYHAIIPIMVLFFLSIKKKSRLKKFYTVLTIIAFIAIVYNGYLLLSGNYLQNIRQIQPDLIRNSISDLGGKMGVGIFNIALLFIGLLVLWGHRKKFYSAYYSFIILALLYTFIDFSFIIYLNIVVILIGAFGFYHLLKRRWQLKIIKTLTQLLVICGLLFSTVSYIDRVGSMEPNNEIVDSLLWLKSNSDEDGVILSHESNGFWIEYISERITISDSITKHTPGARIIQNLSDEVFYSRDLVETTSLLQGSGVSHIWVDSKMGSGEVWTKNKEGLLFLFRNSETFKKPYNSTNVRVWEFLKR